jgi:hypothetical protein
VLRKGTRLWLWPGNTTDAQLFDPKPVGDTGLHEIYLPVQTEDGTLYLTVTELGQDVLVDPDLGEAPERYRVTLESKVEPPEPTPFIGAPPFPGQLTPEHQQWKFEEVQGSTNTYAIKSVALDDRALTAGGGENGSRLLLRNYEGLSSQHWVVEDLGIDEPSSVMLEDFEYFPGGKLLGEISWQVTTGLIDYFQVEAFNNELGGEYSPLLSKTTRSWDIDFEPGTDARDKEWCFRISAVNARAGTDIERTSNKVCEIARRNTPSTTTYSKAIIQNCHNDKIDVRVWISVNGGAWQDLGLLGSQWSNSACPFTGTPKTIELENGAVSVIKALDSRCGSSSPLETQGNCHVLTTPPLTGNDSSTNVYAVQIG